MVVVAKMRINMTDWNDKKWIEIVKEEDIYFLRMVSNDSTPGRLDKKVEDMFCFEKTSLLEIKDEIERVLNNK